MKLTKKIPTFFKIFLGVSLIYILVLWVHKRYQNEIPSIPRAQNLTVKKDWHDYEAIHEALSRKGEGEVGAAVSLDEYRKKMYREYGYDAVLSDEISVNRSVPDLRAEECKYMKQLANLPKVSIIIIFYNERLSVLLRTVHGIKNRTPKELIHEIILVDDCSTYLDLHNPLTEYLRVYLPDVRLIRLPKRSGLMVARMTAARTVSKEGKVLLFLDSHFEVNYNWLPPLLEPIALNPKACTVPSFDKIKFDDFKYTNFVKFRGYFNWNLVYYIFPLLDDSRILPAQNFYEYVLMGGAIAIGADFFWELGGFDEGMILWGGEQFELSFKLWMCGGEIIQVPCSRMAHLFRDPKTKGNTNLYGNYSFLERNFKRFVEVWMDDKHREIVYKYRPSIKNANAGNLTDRFAIRDRLKCKSFSWMMENKMSGILEDNPYIKPNDLASGLIRNLEETDYCLALSEDLSITHKSCPEIDTIDGKDTYWIYDWRGQIHNNKKTCLDLDIRNYKVTPYKCHKQGGNQKWYYDRKNQWIAHVVYKMCMIANKNSTIVGVSPCDPGNSLMKWSFTKTNQTEMDAWDSKLNWRSKVLKKV